MGNEKVFAMTFSKVYVLLIEKAERKGAARQKLTKLPLGLPDTPCGSSMS